MAMSGRESTTDQRAPAQPDAATSDKSESEATRMFEVLHPLHRQRRARLEQEVSHPPAG
jgi:hypothetical protein